MPNVPLSVLVAIGHKTINSRDLSIMTTRFLPQVMPAWCVHDLDYFSLDALAYMYLH